MKTVSLMVDVFRNDVFVQSQDKNRHFRCEYVMEQHRKKFTGLMAMGKVSLVTEPWWRIKQEFQQEVDKLFRRSMQRTLFITIVTLLATIVMALTLSLAGQVTNNLGLIRRFLKHDNGQRPS